MTQKKTLGVWMLTALVAGNMIGSGIFLLPSALAGFGSISLFGWLFTAVGTVLLALLFAELAQFMPAEGGPYAYCRDAFGEFIGFLVAYNYWLALWIGNAGIAVAFVSYAGDFFPFMTHSALSISLSAQVTVWVLTLLNCRGIGYAGAMQILLTVLKITPLLLVGFLGLWHIHPDYFSTFNVTEHSNLSAFSATATLTLWAFIGVESATIPVANIENPKRTIPRATLYGTLLAATAYIISNIAIMGVIPNHILSQSTAPYADAAKILFGPWGRYLIGFGAMCSCLGALNGWIMLQAQIPYAAAKDKLFPANFSQLNRYQSPFYGLIVSSALIALVLIFRASSNTVEQFTFFIELAVFATLVPYILSTMAKIILVSQNPAAFATINKKRSIAIASLAFIYSFWAVYGSGQQTVFYGVLLLFSGVPIYVWMKWGEGTPVLEEKNQS